MRSMLAEAFQLLFPLEKVFWSVKWGLEVSAMLLSWKNGLAIDLIDEWYDYNTTTSQKTTPATKQKQTNSLWKGSVKEKPKRNNLQNSSKPKPITGFSWESKVNPMIFVTATCTKGWCFQRFLRKHLPVFVCLFCFSFEWLYNVVCLWVGCLFGWLIDWLFVCLRHMPQRHMYEAYPLKWLVSGCAKRRAKKYKAYVVSWCFLGNMIMFIRFHKKWKYCKHQGHQTTQIWISKMYAYLLRPIIFSGFKNILRQEITPQDKPKKTPNALNEHQAGQSADLVTLLLLKP